MTAQEVLSYLLRQGIELWMEGDRLRYRGLKRTLPPPLVALLRQHKAELQRLLHERKNNPIAPFPLSYTQKAFWFLYQMNPTSSAYNASVAATLRGLVSQPALHKAFKQLCMRHPGLRTSLVLRDGVAWQQVDATPSSELAVIDATAWSDGALREQVQAEAHRPFDLLQEAPLRVRLYKRSAEEWVLLLGMHHIHVDGWSMGILIRDFGALYRSQLSGEPARLPPLPAAYSDFVAWQQHLLMAPEGESQLTYWVDELVGAPQVLDLPTDWPRPRTRQEKGVRLHWTIDAELSQRVKARATQEGTTLNVLLLSTFASVLHRYTGQEEFLIGSPYHGRNERRWEHVLGCFINTLVLRLRFPAGLTFRALLQQVRQSSHSALAHADYPFPLVVERMRPQRDPSRTPLFQVLFGYENFQSADLLLSNRSGAAPSPELDSLFGVPLLPWELSQQEGQFDLSMTAMEANGVVCYSLSYSTALFERRTIEKLSSHFEQLLRAVTDNPEQAVAALPLLSAADYRQLLVDWNATQAELALPPGLALAFAAQVAQTPDSVAVVYEGQSLTYAELNAWANQLAHHLRSLGVGPDVLVGLMVERSLELVVGLLGILKAGGAYLPLDPDSPKDRIAFMLEEGRPAAVVTQRQLADRISDLGIAPIFMDERAFLASYPTANPPVSTSTHHLAYTIFTSGSTGRPKGVCISQGAVLNLAQALHQLCFGDRPQRVAWVAPAVFDASVQQIFGALLYGHSLYVVSQSTRRDARALLSFLRTQAIELCDCTPSLFSLLVEAGLPGAENLCLRTLLCGGEELAAALVAALYAQDRHPDLTLINVYGPTECCVDATAYSVRPGQLSEQRKTVPIGRPLANTEVYILDSLLQPVPIGVPGQLYIGGVGLARGYLNRPELTQKKFIAHPFAAQPGSRLYQTGDLGRFLTDGNIEFLGRIDQQVKLRGFRIELGEIESVLASHREVRACAVQAREDNPGDKRLVAYVVPQPGRQPSGASLREYLAAKLPDYMLPAVFVFLAALPQSPNGKLDRQALPPPSYERSVDALQAPRTLVERVLVDIFVQLLHLEQVGIDENFFSLGGHSLLATRAVSRIREVLGIELPVAALFAAPTASGLAAVIAAIDANRDSAATEDVPPVVRVPRDAPLPLSFAQQRLWFLEQLEPGLPLYIIPTVLRLRGPLNRESLHRALSEIVSRHEVLRTTFASGEREAVQHIHPPPPSWPLPLRDLSALPAASIEAEIRRLAEQEARRPFSLEHGPLLRTTLLRVAQQDHVLLLTMHHIISDGWSLGVLFRELSALYTAFSEHKPSGLDELRVQVADISAWQRGLLQGEGLQQALAYWKQQLAGIQPLDLPSDYPRPSVLSHRGRIVSFMLDAQLGAALKTLAQSQQATLYMALLGTFSLLLSRYSQQPDIVVGSPIASRTSTEMEPLIGCFVNTLVLRTSFADNPTFRVLLARLRQTCLDAYSHQQVPFERLVDELRVTRDRSRNPLFQVMFVLQNAPLGELRLPNLESSYMFVHNETAKFDLTLSLEERADGSLAGVCEYATDIFAPATIERLTEHYKRLLQAVVEHPDRPLVELPLVVETERQQLLVQWNATRAELMLPPGLAQAFADQVAQTPDSVAVVYEDQRLTYRELNAWANQLAHHLRSQGVGPDVLVGLMVERSVELVVGILGILKAGGAYLPLDPDSPLDRLAFILEEGRPAALVTQRQLAASFPSGAPPLVFMEDRELLSSQLTSDPAPVSAAHHLAYTIFTSGSTGRPKGVCISQGSVLNLAQALRQLAFGGRPLRVAWVAPAVFDASVQQLFGALLYGHSLYVVSQSTRRDAQALLSFLRTQAIELCDCTPSLLRLLIDAGLPGAQDLCLRTLLCGGEELPAALVAALYAQHNHPELALINVYGPTECCVDATAYAVRPGQLSEQRSSVPIGRPLANTEVYILDSQLQPVPIGVPGQLYIGGSGLARGYLNRPELTRERFVAHPFSQTPGARLYQTGDLGRFLPDGNIEFLGRIDHQVKLRGFRIELGEIEFVLASHRAVQACAVLAREDVPGDKRLVAYVVPHQEQPPSGASLRDHLATKLPDYMLPAAFVFLAALPQSPNGKLDRQALPPPTYERIREPFTAPRTPTERILVEIFAELLHLTRVSIHDSFFALGGHSLLAVRLFTQVARRTGQTLPLSALFQHPTAAGLAAALRDAAVVQAPKTVVPLQQAGTRPPLFCVHPVGGNVLCYMELARALGTEQPVYGVQATPVAAADSAPPETLEAVAGRYVAAIRQVQPSGPYQLLGWSLGGVLAFEMARQLVQVGQRVALLALLDSYAPGSPLPELQAAPSEQLLLRWFLGDLTRQKGDSGAEDLPLEGLTELGPALSLLRERGLLPPDAQEAQLEALYALFRRNLQLTPGYRPGVYAGPLLLLQAASPAVPAAPDHGWRELCSGPLELVELPGDHYTIIGPQAVDAVVHHLGSRLIGSEPASRP